MSSILAVIVVLIFLGGNAALFSGDTEGVELFVFLAVLADVAIVIGILAYAGEAVSPAVEKRHNTKMKEKRKNVMQEIKNEIAFKKEIFQVFERYFAEIEQQLALVALLAACMGNQNCTLEKQLLGSKEEAFQSTKKEAFKKLPKKEQQRFPQTVQEVSGYKQTLKKEITELEHAMHAVSGADEEELASLVQAHCPKLHRNILRERWKTAAIIVIPSLVVITLCIVLSPGFAFGRIQRMHESILTDKLEETNASCYVQNIAYDERYTIDGVLIYDVETIRMRYDGDFSDLSENECEALLLACYKKMPDKCYRKNHKS